MCKFKSAIIMKDRIFMPDYDSHSKMLEELGIADTEKNAERLFVRAELSPKYNDVFSDIDNWVFNVDQDIRPDWFVQKYEETRMRKAVKKWAKKRIHIGVDGLKIKSGGNHYIKDCKNVEVCGNGIVERVCGNGIVNKVHKNGTVNEVCGNGTVEYVCNGGTVNAVYGNGNVKFVCNGGTVNEVYENGTVEYVCENGTVNKVCGNGTVEYVCNGGTVNAVCGNGIVNEVYGNGIINEVYGNGIVTSSPRISWQNAGALIITENATFKDCYTKTIYQSGNWKMVAVES